MFAINQNIQIKKDTNSALPRKIESKDGELVSYVNSSILSKKNVVNNQYMQNRENFQTLQSKKITQSNDVDIILKSNYNKYGVTRKKGYKEGETHASFNFSNAEKEQTNKK